MKKITIKTSGDVYKSNPLLESSLGMSVIMGRIFTLALLQVQPILTSNGKFTGFERINIEPEIVKNICGCGFTSYYKRLKYEVDNFKNWVNLRNSDDPREGFEYRPLFDHIDFTLEKGLEFKFADCMAPYIAELNGRHYTRIAAKHIFALSSVYAVRILEILLEYRNISFFKKTGIITRNLSIDEIRSLFGVTDEKYKQHSDIIKKVIKAPVAEINKVTPFSVSYQVVKKRGRISYVVLKMVLPSSQECEALTENIEQVADIRKEEHLAKVGVASHISIDNPNENVRNILIYYGVGSIVAAKIAKAYSREHIINNVKYSISRQNRVTNMGAYIARAIKEDYYKSRVKDEDKVKSVSQLEREYKAKLEAFLEKYGLPRYLSGDLMDDNRIALNRNNSSFKRMTREKGFDLESLIISVQKREMPEPPIFENAVKFVPESEVQAKTETAEEVLKEYPQGTELERKLENPWVYAEIMDFVRDGKPMSPFVEGRIREKGLTVEYAIAEARALAGQEEISAEEIATEISTETEIKTESEQEPEPIAVSPVSESSSAPEPQIDIMAKLKELSQMYQAGLLTDEEFKAAKKAVLSL